ANTQGTRATATLLDPRATWQVADMLAGVAPPEGSARLGVAYKTGTSYGYRDAWSVGYDGRHVIGVWVGRPDGAAVPGLSGYASAAPILFEAFAKSGVGITPLPRPPAGATRTARANLPVTLKRFRSADEPARQRGVAESAPQIVFPPSGARVELAQTGVGARTPLVRTWQGGRA